MLLKYLRSLCNERAYVRYAPVAPKDCLVNTCRSSDKNGTFTVICKYLGLALLGLWCCLSPVSPSPPPRRRARLLPTPFPDPRRCRLRLLLCTQTFPYPCLTPCHCRGNLPIWVPHLLLCSYFCLTLILRAFQKSKAEIQSLLRLGHSLDRQMDVVIKTWWEQGKMLPPLC